MHEREQNQECNVQANDSNEMLSVEFLDTTYRRTQNDDVSKNGTFFSFLESTNCCYKDSPRILTRSLRNAIWKDE